MSGIHNEVLEAVAARLTAVLITEAAADDPAKAGLVKIGPLQGDPAPDVARISVLLFESDPDSIAKGAVTAMPGDWSDELEESEIGGAVTMKRRFTIKARCLFARTGEDEAEARTIASTIRRRLERTLLMMSFSGVKTEDEYVARGVISEDLRSEALQAGGPPDAFDYIIKVRFAILTTQTGVNP